MAEILHEGKYVKLARVGRYEYAERKKGVGAVIILAVTDDDKLILTQQFRVPVQKEVIALPAGMIADHGEEEGVFIAASRELLEETGYEAERIYCLTEGPSSAGLSSEMIVFVRAEGLKKVEEGGGVGDENIKVHEVPMKELTEWLLKKRKAGILLEPKIYTGLFFWITDHFMSANEKVDRTSFLFDMYSK